MPAMTGVSARETRHRRATRRRPRGRRRSPRPSSATGARRRARPSLRPAHLPDGPDVHPRRGPGRAAARRRRRGQRELLPSLEAATTGRRARRWCTTRSTAPSPSGKATGSSPLCPDSRRLERPMPGHSGRRRVASGPALQPRDRPRRTPQCRGPAPHAVAGLAHFLEKYVADGRSTPGQPRKNDGSWCLRKPARARATASRTPLAEPDVDMAHGLLRNLASSCSYRWPLLIRSCFSSQSPSAGSSGGLSGLP